MPGLTWGGSSAGRASRSQCEGREFDPPPLHQFYLALALLFAVWGAAPAAAAPAAVLPALHELADFPIGVAVPAGTAGNSLLKSPERQALVARHFNSLTAENIMKMAYLQPERGVFRFAEADALLDYARAHGMVLHGHALIWHSQTPRWLATLEDSRDVWVEALHQQVRSVATHFAGKLVSWDVVNEAFDDTTATDYRKSQWFNHIGPEFIEMAFRDARAADPAAKLYYNDYDTEGSIGPQKLDRILVMADDFKRRNVPLDGIGFQMHIELEKPAIADIRAAFAKVAERGLLVRISELDIAVNASKQYTMLDEPLAELQRQRYREVIEAYLDAVPGPQRGGVTVWGITDGDSWIPGFRRRADWPLLFDAAFQPKPALRGVAEGLSARPQAGVLRIGTPGDYAPYAWYDTATDSYRGSDIALARALAARLGLRARIVPTTWASLVADAKAGRFDIAVGGISVTPERERVAAFSKPLAEDRKQPVVRCGEEKRYDSAAEINRTGVRLIVNPGGTNERFAREQFPAAALVVHTDNRTVFEEIRAGRADVMVTDSVEGRLQQRAQTGLCVASVRETWAPASKAVWVVSATLKPAVDSALQQLGGVRRYTREVSRWEAAGASVAGAPSAQLTALIDARLAVVTEVARAKWNAQAAIEDLAREQALLLSMRESGAKLGVPAGTVDHFFGAQIKAAKLLQRELFVAWRRSGQGELAGTADLAELRTAIDRINARMLEQLAMTKTADAVSESAASTMAMVSAAAVKVAQGH
jgi:endo-1,4-beta-xylanase